MEAASSSSSKGFMANVEQPHVLAVDDSLVDRKLIEKLLTNLSCKVTTAENGASALEFLGLGDQHNSLESNGEGSCSYLQVSNSKESSIMKEVPVVIMSSENIPNRINKCLEEGAQMFMLKPLKQSDMKKLRYHLMNCSS
ncbi:two-component response regulator ARR17 isoform X3 [Pyrus x bretschneideri]|uniref:two-component response regulator ARR17 isoform X3 n=1 Tax=Pyrus x bretschneideri TaxID=225117 RepID=UPI00202E204C|nr:two-component response regulator ARR17 isoform X3 [Pyrus x bretschneideri]